MVIGCCQIGMDAGHIKSRVLQERTNTLILPKSSTSHRPTSPMESHIQAILTPLATRKAQLQRTLSVARPNSPAKRPGSALAKGERKPSHHVEREDSVERRNTKEKNLVHVLPVNTFSTESEAKSSGLPVSTYLNQKLADISRRPSLSQANGHSSPRTIRYCEAEEALAAALKCCQDGKPTVDLQIDALKRATFVLNTRISDAAEQVEKLRGLLANRAADPAVYQSMQRERWMEEKRKLAAEHLSNVLEQHLTTLSSLPPPSQASSPAQPPPSTSNFKAKANSNLIAFFESSSHQRISTRNRGRHVSVPPRSRPSKKVESPPRIHNHKQLLPLRLKVSNPEPLFQRRKPNTTSLTRPPPTSVQGSGSTCTTSPPTSSPSTPKSSASHLAPIQEAPDSDDSVDQVPHPLPNIPVAPSNSSDDTGTAMIWHSSPRSAADILSDFSVSVELPKYVGDLLSEFEASTSASAGSRLRILSEFPHTDTQGRTEPRTLHTSSSFKRISALFSLGEGFSGVEGRGLSTRLKRMSGLRR